MSPKRDTLLLGIDGGGTRCRARLCTFSLAKLGEGTAGPANIRLGLEQSFASVHQATIQCLTEARLSPRDLGRTVACLALAGASEPSQIETAQRHRHPYRKALFVPDAQAACIGAHRGRRGGIIVLGTGTIGWAELDGRNARVGGWGWPISDEGSGAWLGCEGLRRTLWAHDGRIRWTALLKNLFDRFRSEPDSIVRWMTGALPRDFARFATLVVEHASQGDAVAVELMRLAGGHIDELAARLIALGAHRLALDGGLAESMEPWLADATRRHLVPARGDAMDGALQLAREAACADEDRDRSQSRRLS
jgi:glucosamine kinase